MDRPPIPRRCRLSPQAALATLLGLPLALALGPAQAQKCTSTAGDNDPTQKYTLIARQCGLVVVPSSVSRSAQLELYDRPSVTITVPVNGAAPPSPPAPPASASLPAAPREPLQPIGRDGARILTVAPALTEAARAYRLDPLLLHAIAHVESRHNPAAISPAGARGVMQVMPATARRFGVGDPERGLMQAQTNVNASAALLRSLSDRYGDDLALILAAYNAGEGAVERHGRQVPPFAETQAYVRDVTAVYRRLGTRITGRDFRRLGQRFRI